MKISTHFYVPLIIGGVIFVAAQGLRADPLVTLTQLGPSPNVGDNFDIAVSVTGGDSFANGLAGMTFDSSKVSFVSATAGAVFGSFFGTTLVSGNQLYVPGSFQFTDSRTATGLLATFTFKALISGSAVFSSLAKNLETDPDFGRTGFAKANGTYLPTSIAGPLNVTILPEPGTLTLLALSAIGLMRIRQRKH